METAQSLDLFLTESHRYLSVLNNFLTALQESPCNSEILDELYRLGATLRDNVEGMGFEGISQITYNIETLLNAIQNSEYDSTAEVVDLLLGTMEVLSIQLDAIRKYQKLLKNNWYQWKRLLLQHPHYQLSQNNFKHALNNSSYK